MNCAENVNVVMAVGRVLILLFGMGAGTLAIYFGWRLCQSKIISETSTDIRVKSWRIALTAGPGIFLALFGMGIIGFIVTQKFEFTEQDSIPTASVRQQFQSSARFEGQFFKVQAERPLADPPKCLVRTRNATVRMYDGDGTGPTAEEVRKALDLSLQALGNETRRRPDTMEARSIRKAINTLEYLRDGVVE